MDEPLDPQSPLITISRSASSEYQTSPPPHLSAGQYEPDPPPLPQPHFYRDYGFALLFYVQLVGMIVVFVLFGKYATTTTQTIEKTILNNDDAAYHQFDAVDRMIEAYVKNHLPQILCFIVLPTAVAALLLAVLVLAFVIPMDPVLFCQMGLVMPAAGVAMMLLLVCATSTPSSLLTLMMGGTVLGVLVLVRRAWQYVPFGAANLRVAVQCINSNWGIYMLAMLFSVLGFVWNLFWVYTSVGLLTYQNLLFYQVQTSSSSSSSMTTSNSTAVITNITSSATNPIEMATAILLFISFCWTGTVLLVSNRKRGKGGAFPISTILAMVLD